MIQYQKLKNLDKCFRMKNTISAFVLWNAFWIEKKKSEIERFSIKWMSAAMFSDFDWKKKLNKKIFSDDDWFRKEYFSNRNEKSSKNCFSNWKNNEFRIK